MRSLADTFLVAFITDIGTAAALGEFYPVPDRGRIRKLSGVVSLQPTTTAAVITLSVNGVNQTPTLTIPISLTPTSVAVFVDMNVPVEEGDHVRVSSDGGPANAPAGFFTAVLARAEAGA